MQRGDFGTVTAVLPTRELATSDATSDDRARRTTVNVQVSAPRAPSNRGESV